MTMTRSKPLPLPLFDEPARACLDDSLSDENAGFGALETARGRLPLVALDVTGRIDGLLSQVTVCQTFVNATGEPLEATYIFPLPDRAAVTDFRMEVAGRLVEGVLKERGQARREYSRALRRGHRASIAEEERPGVFTLRVGNLMPGDAASVTLRLVGILPYSDGEVTFRFPLVVAPRYIPGVPLSGLSVGDGTAVDTALVPDASRISPPVLLRGFPNPVRLSLVIDLYQSDASVDDLRVSLFTVWGEEQGGVRRLTLQPGERLDRDFILRFRLGGNSVQTSLSLHPDSAQNDEGTFALALVPPSTGDGSLRPRDVVFVLDRSGSMDGWKMVAARRAVARMVDTLNESDRFAVLAFDDRIESPQWGGREGRSQLIPASDRNRFRAVEFLAKLESRGGTEIAESLKQAVMLLAERRTRRDSDCDRVIFLVTDGQVGNEDQVLGVLGARASGIRIFTLGIDQAVNQGFLHRLAKLGAGGGSCELVESEERLDAVMDSIHRRIGTPVVTDLGLEPSKGKFKVVADTLVPDRPPCLFAGSPLLLLGRYRGRDVGPVAVTGKTGSGVTWRQSIMPVVRDNPAIAAAWARGQVRQLEDRYAAGMGDRSRLEEIIIATSLRFGVLCRFTAYVAVDHSQVVNEGGEVHKITQPVEMPAGWVENVPSVLAESLEASFRSSEPIADDTGFRAEAGGAIHLRLMREAAGIDKLAHPSGVARPVPPCPAALPPSLPVPTPDDRLREEGFSLCEEIGRDEYGVLHKARDDHGQLRAVRILTNPASAAEFAGFVKRLKTVTRVKQTAIAPILRWINDVRLGTVIAVVSEYVAGPTLAKWISHHPLPDPGTAAQWMLILAESLERSARKGIVHGHLTGDTIRIGADGKPCITDFGLAQLAGVSSTPSGQNAVYIAPELVHVPGAPPTARSDVYSLGVIFFQLLTGALPDLNQSQSRSPRAVNPRVPAEFDAICMKALTPDPAGRYSGTHELAADLRTALGLTHPEQRRRIGGRSKPKLDTPPEGEKDREGFWK